MAVSKKERLLKKNTVLKIRDKDMVKLLTAVARDGQLGLFSIIDEQFKEQIAMKKHQGGCSQFNDNGDVI
jgi:hypothetical protein